MKFYYSSIKPYEGSPIDNSGGEVPEWRTEKASQFWAGNPHPGWKNMLQGPEETAWWAGEGVASTRCSASRWNWWEQYWPRLLWVNFLRLSPVLLEIQLRTWAICSVSPNPEELTSLATWQIHSVIQSDRGQTEGTSWQMWRRCPDLFLRLLEIIDKFNCGRSLPTPVSVPLHLCREMNSGFVVVFIRG